MGGGVQVSVGFLRHAVAVAGARGWRLAAAVSPGVAAEAGDLAGAVDDWWVAERRPASLVGGHSSRRELRQRARAFGADVVFTVFGPSYVRFDVPELMGFANPFVMTPVPGRFDSHPAQRVRSAVTSALRKVALQTADEYWVETETARAGLARAGRIRPDRIHVVANGVNARLVEELTDRPPAAPPTILMVGAAYRHKNHSILPRVARRLDEIWPGQPWRIAVTLPDDSAVWQDLARAARAEGQHHRFVNVGHLPLRDLAEAYADCTMVLHPSLIEAFSATYLEAMAARRPLVVSDRDFAREICDEAALYVEPRSPDAIAAAIHQVLTDPVLIDRLVATGEGRLDRFPDASAKNDRLSELIDQLPRGTVRAPRTSDLRARLGPGRRAG